MSARPTLPGSDVEIFPLNLGGNPFGWTADEEASFAVLDAFHAAGGTFIDTADSYSAWVDRHVGGESERIIGRWLAERGLRDEVVVATKVGAKPDRKSLARDSVARAVEESLERLGTDHLDLYYLHYDDEAVPVAEQVETFHALVEAGTVRAIGLSNFSPARMREWFETAVREGLTVPAAVQPRYSLVSRSGYEQDYAPVVTDFGPLVFSYPALASGFLTRPAAVRGGRRGAQRRVGGVLRRGVLGRSRLRRRRRTAA